MDASQSERSFWDQHLAEVGPEVFEQEEGRLLLDQLEAELDDVEVALRRLDEGTYGICEACGGAIGEETLLARPEARFCVTHQELAERGAKGVFGG
jgi:DnaK suppressor protein